MISIKFNGIIFEPKEDRLQLEHTKYLEKIIGEDWIIDSLGENLPLYIIKCSSELSAAEAWNITYLLQATNYFLFVEPDFDSIDHSEGFLINCDEHLPNTQYEHWCRTQLNVEKAWLLKPQFQTGSQRGKGIIVGHTDTGYTKHRETWGNNPSMANPRLLHKRGWDYFANDNDAYDDSWSTFITHFGHGTSTSSLIFSNPADGGYINGVADQCSIIPIRTDHSVIVNMERVIRSISFATYKGCHITSTSMGHVLGDGHGVDRVLQEAIKNGIIPFAAAGQAGGWAFNILPARSQFCISCTASNINKQHWSKAFSSNYIEIAAPGESVWVADMKNQNDVKRVDRYCGTSFSTALTAGAAALWYAYISPEVLIQTYGKDKIFWTYLKTLNDYGISTPANWDTVGYGPGILDVESHLKGSANLPSIEEIDKFKELHIEKYTVTETQKTLELFSLNGDQGHEVFAGLFTVNRNGLEEILREVGAELRFHIKANSDIMRSLSAIISDNTDQDLKFHISEIKTTISLTASTKLKNLLNT